MESTTGRISVTESTDSVVTGSREVALRLAFLAFIGVGGALLPSTAYAQDCSCNAQACKDVGYSGCCSGTCDCGGGVCTCICC